MRQYLRPGLIDELHIALSPVVFGQGETIFAGIDLPAFGYSVTEHQAAEHATHVVLSRYAIACAIITPWTDRVQLIDAKYVGARELPAIGVVVVPTAVLILLGG